MRELRQIQNGVLKNHPELVAMELFKLSDFLGVHVAEQVLIGVFLVLFGHEPSLNVVGNLLKLTTRVEQFDNHSPKEKNEVNCPEGVDQRSVGGLVEGDIDASAALQLSQQVKGMAEDVMSSVLYADVLNNFGRFLRHSSHNTEAALQQDQ